MRRRRRHQRPAVRLGRPRRHRGRGARGGRPRARPAPDRGPRPDQDPGLAPGPGHGCTPKSAPRSTSRSRPARLVRPVSAGHVPERLRSARRAFVRAARRPGGAIRPDGCSRRSPGSSGSMSPTIAQTAATCSSRPSVPALLRFASSWSMAPQRASARDSSVEHTVEDYQPGGAASVLSASSFPQFRGRPLWIMAVDIRRKIARQLFLPHTQWIEVPQLVKGHAVSHQAAVPQGFPQAAHNLAGVSAHLVHTSSTERLVSRRGGRKMSVAMG